MYQIAVNSGKIIILLLYIHKSDAFFYNNEIVFVMAIGMATMMAAGAYLAGDELHSSLSQTSQTSVLLLSILHKPSTLDLLFTHFREIYLGFSFDAEKI